MIDSPELQREVSRVRERAKEIRKRARTHSEAPQWDLVGDNVIEPLKAIRDSVNEELAKLDKNRRLVPLDRDPVPERFEDLVRQYYERLGSGK